jgi:pimeloyl-ACP methyl ester carboxylesterase
MGGFCLLLLIGKQDNTAIGKALALEAAPKNLGVYAQLAPEAAARLPQAKLVMFDDLGHAPQIQDPLRFQRALLEGLARWGQGR